ncbi:unnamed protein product [Nippostrongylus brasiliensis]|uniref:Branched-chain-amino-acid aminotransferase (inferred by orthology to a D. melanogaster protein) n=1 Tax=Nippostrongylus brasiliensis TaxID=27835 RepID=A0A0N4XN61_NIPBR|nr:unnamed protein product [Nippostrongylus brasiliensis]
MNVFMYWKNENGEDELITPTLESGVTRRSMLDLAREMGVKVSERDFTMDEVYEFFGTGTAVVVSPIDRILYKVDGREIELQFPLKEEKSIMNKLFTAITDIQFGRQQRPEWTIEI